MSGARTCKRTLPSSSPNPYLVGFKPDGDLAYVNLDAERSVEVIAVDPSLEKIEATDLKLIRYERRYVSALVKQANGTYKYESVEKEITLDGARIQAHRAGNDIAIFTRNLADITDRVPEIVSVVRSLDVSTIVLDGEAIAIRADGPHRVARPAG